MSKLLLSEKTAREFVSQLFMKIGACKEHADQVADHLTQAEMRGQASHGLNRIPFYAQKLQKGGYNIRPEMKILKETAGTALLDGDDALGVVSGSKAMELCIKKAKESGCAAIAVKNANHIGFLAYYTLMAAREGMIGLAICNSGASTAVFGTSKPVLGTDPFSIALPAYHHLPLVLDCATSVVAQGKVAVADREGKSIPGHWAYDKEGNPTTDAGKALEGTMRPFGDYKGSGIAIMISLICCCLTGMPFDMEEENQRRIHDATAGSALADLFIAIDISPYTYLDSFTKRVDQFIDIVKQYDLLPDTAKIYMPGEKEFDQMYRCRKNGGFEIGTNLYQKLQEISAFYGLEYDFTSWLLKT